MFSLTFIQSLRFVSESTPFVRILSEHFFWEFRNSFYRREHWKHIIHSSWGLWINLQMKITSTWTVHLPWRNIEFRADLTWAFVIPTWAFFQCKIRMHYIIAGIHSNPIRFIQRLVCFDHCFLVKMFFWGICQQNPMRFKVFFQSEIEKKIAFKFQCMRAYVRVGVRVCKRLSSPELVSYSFRKC